MLGVVIGIVEVVLVAKDLQDRASQAHAGNRATARMRACQQQLETDERKARKWRQKKRNEMSVRERKTKGRIRELHQ